MFNHWGRPALRGRVLIVVAAFCALGGFQVASASAESCVYDSNTKQVTATVTAGSAATLVVSLGELRFGLVPAPCGGATTTNTDFVRIIGASGSNETIVLDQRGGTFGPGATAEGNIPEIEMAIELGDATDTVVVFATEGDDSIAPGQNGLALTSDGDLDITLSPNPMKMEIYGLGGVDYINGRGQSGAGLHYLGQLVVDGGEGNDTLVRGSSENDIVRGGPGNDIVDAQEGDDLVDGGPGNDTISVGSGNDDVTGGPGVDSFAGSNGNDIFRAEDDEVDLSFNGGPGTDTLYYDLGLDPAPTAVEVLIPDGPPPPPPPPPPGSCVYDSAAKTATASIPAGGSATVTVSGGSIAWGSGASPSPCGAATTTNTDTIVVVGQAGSTEGLTIDGSGGQFAPGATAESSGTSEIEIQTTLGDTSDSILVLGTSGNDTIVIGQSGIGLTGDADADVTFSPIPTSIEARGLGGVNTLTGLGASGTGSAFTGSLTLVAGDSGGTLTGGNGNDTLTGGAGNDVMDGRIGNDAVDGGGGNDTVNGGDGNDTLTGGGGTDSLNGGAGNDTIRADDDLADSSINGGPGTDTAYYDLGIDPNPLATESKVPA